MEKEIEEEVEEVKSEVVPKRYRDEYKARGNPRTCSDDFSELFSLVILSNDKRPQLLEPILQEIAEKNDIDYSKYAGLNNGMKRMNVGNKLRSKLRKGESIWWPNGEKRLTPVAAGFDVQIDEDQ